MIVIIIVVMINITTIIVVVITNAISIISTITIIVTIIVIIVYQGSRWVSRIGAVAETAARELVCTQAGAGAPDLQGR